MRHATAVGFAVLALVAFEPLGAAPKAVNYVYADAMTFRNAPGSPTQAADGITSDATGPTYTNGSQGVVLQLFTGGSGDLTFALGTRRLRASTDGTTLLTSWGPTPPGPVSCANGYVENIWGIPKGGSALRTVAFGGCAGVTTNDLIDFGDHNNNGAGMYSYQVIVTRSLGNQWTITTDNLSPIQAVYQTQISQHPNRTGWTAEYGLRFQLTVSCNQNCP